MTLCTLRAATVLSRDCRADFGRPLAKKVMSHSRDGPGVTAPLRTNVVPLTGVWNTPPSITPLKKSPKVPWFYILTPYSAQSLRAYKLRVRRSSQEAAKCSDPRPPAFQKCPDACDTGVWMNRLPSTDWVCLDPIHSKGEANREGGPTKPYT